MVCSSGSNQKLLHAYTKIGKAAAFPLEQNWNFGT